MHDDVQNETDNFENMIKYELPYTYNNLEKIIITSYKIAKKCSKICLWYTA